ncbi:MAG: CGGC domain-containing protein [Eubacteriales bacterium]|nr:CGGC domain-containing protein [Eubacteriales bacterium]
MKKIAMLNCLKSNEVCTGAACMKAFYERKKFFARYEGEEVEVSAFFRCNGCGKNPEEDAGMTEKLDRLVQEGITVVHTGVCTKKKDGTECGTITKLVEMIRQRGISVVRGTH